MAKKKRIITGERYNPVTDKTEVRINKNASEKEVRQFIKENYKKLSKDQLPAKYAGYYGKVEGGKKRAEQAARIDGKFVSKTFIDNGNFEKVAHALGYKNPKELFEKDKDIYNAAKDLRDSPHGILIKYSFDEVKKKIDTYGGKVFINGEEYTRIKAIKRLDDFDKMLKRTKEVYNIDFWASYRKGGAELHFTIPSIAKMENTSLDELLDNLAKAKDKSFEILLSGRPVKKKSDRAEIPEEKTQRYEYEYKIIYKGRHKTGTVFDYTIEFAREQIKRSFRGCQIISVTNLTLG